MKLRFVFGIKEMNSRPLVQEALRQRLTKNVLESHGSRFVILTEGGPRNSDFQLLCHRITEPMFVRRLFGSAEVLICSSGKAKSPYFFILGTLLGQRLAAFKTLYS